MIRFLPLPPSKAGSKSASVAGKKGLARLPNSAASWACLMVVKPAGLSTTTICSSTWRMMGCEPGTGRELWQFHLVKADTWGKGFAEHAGNMAAWAPLSADEQLGIVYVPTSAPTASYYGGHRPGNNLYSDCLLALEAKTGKLVWYFQMVHHDLWDYDNSAPPTLADITVDGKQIHAVIQPNKTGYLYVFDRKTGQPVWPI